MKKLLMIMAIGFVLQACGDSRDENEEVQLEDPAMMQPPSDAIPDSMNIINDSVIVPDNNRQYTDTSRRNR